MRKSQNIFFVFHLVSVACPVRRVDICRVRIPPCRTHARTRMPSRFLTPPPCSAHPRASKAALRPRTCQRNGLVSQINSHYCEPSESTQTKESLALRRAKFAERLYPASARAFGGIWLTRSKPVRLSLRITGGYNTGRKRTCAADPAATPANSGCGIGLTPLHRNNRSRRGNVTCSDVKLSS
jgi:hypothetical protein